MARRKKQTEQAAAPSSETEVNAIAVTEAVPAEAAPVTSSEMQSIDHAPVENATEFSAPSAETAPSDATRDPAAPPGRAWSERFIQPIKYSRSNFKDPSGKHLIAFRFDLPAGESKPSEELLAVLRNHKVFNRGKPVGQSPNSGSDPDSIYTGLHYEDFGPGLGKLWVMPNGELGRTVADALDMALNNLAKKITRDSARGA